MTAPTVPVDPKLLRKAARLIDQHARDVREVFYGRLGGWTSSNTKRGYDDLRATAKALRKAAKG